MLYRIEKIEGDVLVAIDENHDQRGLLADGDTDALTLSEIIRSKVEDGVRRVLLSAPLRLLDGLRAIEGGLHERGDGSGWMLLADDFLRLAVVRLSDWERPVFEAITADDPRYELQFSRYSGIRGNRQKPVAAIVRRAEGLALELYPGSGMVLQGEYVSVRRFDRDGGIEIPERCYRAVVYETAGLVLATIGQAEQSALMRELSKQILV